jgi:outer membrane protein
MKHLSKILLLLFVAFSTTSFAQTFKFGHLNSQELVALMPERDSAVAKLEKYSADVSETMDAMQVEFNTKLNTYQQKQATWTAAVLEAKQKELQEMQARFEQIQQSSGQEYQQLQSLLFAPVFKKANDAIQKIGKDQGFTYIFDVSSGSIPFINLEQSVDIMPLAKKELGIPADKKLPAQQQQ